MRLLAYGYVLFQCVSCFGRTKKSVEYLCSIVRLNRIKPVDKAAVLEAAKGRTSILLEEGNSAKAARRRTFLFFAA
ncbi:MAG: hypothetical protein ACLTE2_02240 [Eubacteriales bacterium]